MKKIIVVMAAISIAVRLYAQGTVNFSNIGGRPVFDFCTGTNAIAGTTFLVQLYFAPDSGVPPIDSFIPLGGSVGLVVPGYFGGGVRTAPVTPPGAFAYFQVRAWESAFGTSYEEAIARSPIGGHFARSAKSNVIRVNTSDPTTIPPETAASLVAAGLAQMTLMAGLSDPCIPEPSVPALAVFGAAVWLALRRRRK